jgi:hypothetical protein
MLASNGCTSGQILKYNGSAWACAADATGGGGGTVTSVAAGTGLAATPSNPITTSGTINLASSYQLPQACAANQVPKWNGTAWICAADANSGGTVASVTAGTGLTATPSNPFTTSGTIAILDGGVNTLQLASNAVTTAKLADGQVTASKLAIDSVTTAKIAGANVTFDKLAATGCAAGQVLKFSGTAWQCQADASGPANAFVQGGNAFGTLPNDTAVLGTAGSATPQALDIRVNGTRVMRYEPNPISPNVIGGGTTNVVAVGVRGATIAGGGADPSDPSGPNVVTDHFGTISGGRSNTAGDASASATDAMYATVGGGYDNRATGETATVGGGVSNLAGEGGSTVGGGFGNLAKNWYATIAGGIWNLASGEKSTVPGGQANLAGGRFSLAAGYRARIREAASVGGGDVDGDEGTFLWADSSDFEFTSTGPNQFGVRATGGVRFVTAIEGLGNATRSLSITPNGELNFVAERAQKINLFGTGYGIGIQDYMHYFRTGTVGDFAWYGGGSHVNNAFDAGGGSVYMTLTSSAYPTTVAVTGLARAQTFTSTSDRNAKTAFAPVSGEDLLHRVVALPISTWVYRNAPSVRHIGPTSQDFLAAFGVGGDDKGIATVDADGVALAAIQGLNAKLEAAETRIARQDQEIAELRRAVEVLMTRTSPEGRLTHAR